MRALLPLLFLVYVSYANPCVKNLKEDLEKNWHYDGAKNFYEGNNKFLEKLDTTYKDCIHGKDTAYIAKLFGEHYVFKKQAGGKAILQYGTKTDLGEKSVATFYFQLDEKLRCTWIYYMVIDKRDPVY